MKKLLLAIFCLKALSCKIQEPKPVKPAPPQFDTVYVGQVNTNDLQDLSIRTGIPGREYAFSLTEKYMLISDGTPTCIERYPITDQDIEFIKNELSQIHLCWKPSNQDAPCPVPYTANWFSLIYKDSFDHHSFLLEKPLGCYYENGVCGRSDILRGISITERFETWLTCAP